MTLKTDILSILKAATEPMDRVAIGKLCLAGTDKQVADQLYLLKKAGEIIGDKSGGSYLYRLPGNVVSLPAELSARMVEEVDEIDLEKIEVTETQAPLIEIERESIEAAKVINNIAAETTSVRTSGASVEALERIALDDEFEDAQDIDLMPDIWKMIEDEPIDGSEEEEYKQESAVSETVKEAIAEPIKQEWPQFRVGVYSDETMVLEKPDGCVFELDKTEFSVMVAFARTVGWLE